MISCSKFGFNLWILSKSSINIELVFSNNGCDMIFECFSTNNNIYNIFVLSNLEIISSSHFYLRSVIKYSSASNIKSQVSSISTGN